VASMWNDDDGQGYRTGSVYMYALDSTGVSPSTWSMVQKITASDGQVNAYFGNFVAMSGVHLAVATSPYKATCGSVYMLGIVL
jgi:hypothetical protein